MIFYSHARAVRSLGVLKSGFLPYSLCGFPYSSYIVDYPLVERSVLYRDEADHDTSEPEEKDRRYGKDPGKDPFLHKEIEKPCQCDANGDEDEFPQRKEVSEQLEFQVHYVLRDGMSFH